MSRRSGRLEAAKDGPRVVVQQVLQVEPPAPEPLATQDPPLEGRQAASKPELKSRLRPNRSSWRERFSPPPPSKNKVKKERNIKEEHVDDEEEDVDSEATEEPPEEPELVIPTPLEDVQQESREEEMEEEEEEVVEEQMETVEAQEPQEQVVEIQYEGTETDRICAVVQNDALIQQFGLNLVNMSTQPQSRATILAVSQRMIELVRLLRAAQGMDSSIESLASLFHVDQWPLIIEAIKYVSGYEDGAARNPQYIYDVGQALRFCAYMLKRDAQENDNLAYEQQAQQFFNSIESNMATLVTQQSVEICSEAAVAPTTSETVTEIVQEETTSQYRVVLGTNAGDSQPVTLSLQQVGGDLSMPGTVQVVKIISTPSGKKGIIIPTRILSKKV